MCGSAARTDLRGGHRVTGVPTATSDELAYEHALIPTSQPFDDVREMHAISELAREALIGPDFSRRIRRRPTERR